MKKAYKAAEMEIVRFGSIDTIYTSGGNDDIGADKIDNEDQE